MILDFQRREHGVHLTCQPSFQMPQSRHDGDFGSRLAARSSGSRSCRLEELHSAVVQAPQGGPELHCQKHIMHATLGCERQRAEPGMSEPKGRRLAATRCQSFHYFLRDRAAVCFAGDRREPQEMLWRGCMGLLPEIVSVFYVQARDSRYLGVRAPGDILMAAWLRTFCGCQRSRRGDHVVPRAGLQNMWIEHPGMHHLGCVDQRALLSTGAPTMETTWTTGLNSSIDSMEW